MAQQKDSLAAKCRLRKARTVATVRQVLKAELEPEARRLCYQNFDRLKGR